MDNPNILTGLADNEALFEAVKSVVFEEFDKIEYSLNATNEHLGEITRAKLVGAATVELAFRKIAAQKSTVPLTQKDNPAF